MQDAKWIEQVNDHEGNECKWAWVRWNVQNITEDIDQQVNTPDNGKETSHLHYTHITEDIDQQVNTPDNGKETSHLHYTHTQRDTEHKQYTHGSSSSKHTT